MMNYPNGKARMDIIYVHYQYLSSGEKTCARNVDVIVDVIVNVAIVANAVVTMGILNVATRPRRRRSLSLRHI
jgi:hypothetical protein